MYILSIHNIDLSKWMSPPIYLSGYISQLQSANQITQTFMCFCQSCMKFLYNSMTLMAVNLIYLSFVLYVSPIRHLQKESSLQRWVTCTRIGVWNYCLWWEFIHSDRPELKLERKHWVWVTLCWTVVTPFLPTLLKSDLLTALTYFKKFEQGSRSPLIQFCFLYNLAEIEFFQIYYF